MTNIRAKSVAKTGATKSGATKSGATKPGATKSGATKPGATKAGATKPGATKTSATKTGATKTSATKTSATKPGATKTSAAKSATKSGATKSGISIVLRGGQAWSGRLKRGQILRLTDTSGRACVSALFYNAIEPLERYNMADTLKAQYTAFLTTGRVLYSDMGRVLVSIIADTCGWHDTTSGCGNATTSRTNFGDGRYQDLRNNWFKNARDNFIVELSKIGLGRRDIVANVNFFVKVAVDDAGRMSWVDRSGAASHVDLRAEMDTWVVLSNTPHHLDPSSTYAPPEVGLTVREAKSPERPEKDDRCRLSRPENGRGFELTEMFVKEMSAT